MKTIKRYPNRKLYDTSESRYITLEEIAEHLKAGGEVRVVDSRSGEDITTVTVAQVLVSEEKRASRNVPLNRLLEAFQRGGEFLQRTLSTPVTSLRDEAERTVQRLMTGEPVGEVREFVERTHQAYEDVQRRVDEHLRILRSTARNLGPILKEMDRLVREMADLKARVARLEAASGMDSIGPLK